MRRLRRGRSCGYGSPGSSTRPWRASRRQLGSSMTAGSTCVRPGPTSAPTPSGLPVVGEQLSAVVKTSITAAANPFVDFGSELETLILVLAAVVSLLVLIVPLVPWFSRYLPWRVGRIRRLRAAHRVVRSSRVPRPVAEELLAAPGRLRPRLPDAAGVLARPVRRLQVGPSRPARAGRARNRRLTTASPATARDPRSLTAAFQRLARMSESATGSSPDQTLITPTRKRMTTTITMTPRIPTPPLLEFIKHSAMLNARRTQATASTGLSLRFRRARSDRPWRHRTIHAHGEPRGRRHRFAG